jgi:hypothetical protein
MPLFVFKKEHKMEKMKVDKLINGEIITEFVDPEINIIRKSNPETFNKFYANGKKGLNILGEPINHPKYVSDILSGKELQDYYKTVDGF